MLLSLANIGNLLTFSMSLDPVKCPARSLCFFGPDTAHMFGPDTAHMFGHCDVNFWIIDLICFSCCRACAICQSGRLET